LRCRTENICQHTFLARLNGSSVVVDFGANCGDFSHEIIRMFGSNVFAVEPVPALVNGIRPNSKLRLFPMAIAGETGSIAINVFDSRVASLFGKITPEEAITTIDVPCMTLAEFKARAGLGHIDLLKVDIEGAELSLFEQSSASDLRDIDQLTVEFHDFIYKEMRPRVEAIKEKMASLGFWVLQFSRDNTDVLFVNKTMSISRVQLFWMGSVIKYSRGIRRILRRRLGLTT